LNTQDVLGPDLAIFNAGKVPVTVQASFTLLRNKPHGDLNFSNADGLQDPSLGYLLMAVMISKLGRVSETETKRLTQAQSMVTENQTQCCSLFQIRAKNTQHGHAVKINSRADTSQKTQCAKTEETKISVHH